MLATALNAIPAFRSTPRLSDEDYISLGRRSNSEEIGYASEFMNLLREGESLDDALEVPFVLARVKDIHVAMQLAVADTGDRREDLTSHSLFFPAFTAFVLGFAIGLVTAHRAKLADSRGGVERLSKRTLELCEEWAIVITIFYLVKVEANGVIDRETDQLAYGIENHWRLVADERRLGGFDDLTSVVEEGKRNGRAWFLNDSIDLGDALAAALDRFIAGNAERTFA